MSRKYTRYISITTIFYILLFLVCLACFYFSKDIREGFNSSSLEKNIWILWLQGWDSPPWLIQQVKKSWEKHNPGWKIHLLTEDNLSNYVDGIDYMNKDSITPQAKSDIIRLSVLQKYGGVWADATLLCMKPLDNWIHQDIHPSGFWMYHGPGGGMNVAQGPASWFIVSRANSYLISAWKKECDSYWEMRSSTDNYSWMDYLFRKLYESDPQFKKEWDAVPYISCEDVGQSHMFAGGAWKENTEEIKKILNERPPRVLKLWKNRWEEEFPDVTSEKCKESNGYYAIQRALNAIGLVN